MNSDKRPRRFLHREICEGRYKGALHVPTKNYFQFMGELTFLALYLEEKFRPSRPEEANMRTILILLQNRVEYEVDEAIRQKVVNTVPRNDGYEKFYKAVQGDDVSFKRKLEWLKARNLLNERQFKVADELRELRNAFTHANPLLRLEKQDFLGIQVMSSDGLKNIFLSIEEVVEYLKKFSGTELKWSVAPLDYKQEIWKSVPGVAQVTTDPMVRQKRTDTYFTA